MVVDKAGNQSLEEVSCLDVGHAKLRDVAVLRDLGLAGLRELNLDNNALSQFVDILSLPSLTVLRLNHNRIEACSPMAASLSGAAAAAPERPACALEVLLLGFNKIGM